MRKTELLRVIFGNVENGFDGKGDIGSKMKFVLIRFSPVGQELEETLILIVSNFRFRPSPQRFDKVDCFSIDGDGEVDEVGVLLHNLLDLGLFDEFSLIGFEMQNNFGAPVKGVFLHF